MIFVDRRAFQNRKVLVVIIRTSDVSEDQGRASIYVSPSSNQRRRIGIDERCTVEEIVCAGSHILFVPAGVGYKDVLSAVCPVRVLVEAIWVGDRVRLGRV